MNLRARRTCPAARSLAASAGRERARPPKGRRSDPSPPGPISAVAPSATPVGITMLTPSAENAVPSGVAGAAWSRRGQSAPAAWQPRLWRRSESKGLRRRGRMQLWRRQRPTRPAFCPWLVSDVGPLEAAALSVTRAALRLQDCPAGAKSRRRGGARFSCPCALRRS